MPGWYKVAGSATDTNTLGPLILHATGTGADPADREFSVVAYNPQDSVRLGLTALPNAAAGDYNGLPSYQQVAQVVYRTDGTVWFVATSGSSGNDGKTWGTAKALPSQVSPGSRDHTQVGPGLFDEGVAKSSAMATYTHLAGAGMRRTTIQSGLPLGSGAIIEPATGAIVSDLTIYGDLSDYQAPLGNVNTGTYQDVRIERVRMVADSDGYYGSTNAAHSIDFSGCQFDTKYDCVMAGSQANTIRIDNSILHVRGPSGTGDFYAQGVAIPGGSPSVYLSNSRIDLGDAVNANGVAILDSGATPYVMLDRVTFRAAGTSTSFDILNQGTGAIILSLDCIGSGTSGTIVTSGTVTVAQSLRPTTAGQTIEVSNKGYASANIRAIQGSDRAADTLFDFFSGLEGVVQAGSTTTSIILDPAMISANASLVGRTIYIHDGDIRGAASLITAYTDTPAPTVTISPAIPAIPVSETRYVIFPQSVPTAAENADPVLTVLGTSGNAGTIGGAVDVAISEANAAHNIVASGSSGNVAIKTAVDAVKAKTDLISGSGSITLVSPVNRNAGNLLKLVAGDDYSEGVRVPTWTIENYTGPTLGTTGTLRFATKDAYDADETLATAPIVASVSATVSTSGDTVTITAPMTADDTIKLKVTPADNRVTHVYQLLVETQAGKINSEKIGDVVVLRNIASS